MTRHAFPRRLTAALLALLLVLGLAPAALAAACPQCGGDVTCTDNGDGRTHTVSCPKDGLIDAGAAHDFAGDGFCTACGAMDYTKVRIVLPEGETVTAARGDKAAALSLEGVRLTLGETDVTDKYTLSYSWYYNGAFVSTGQRCAPPSAVMDQAGDYDFVCFVTAVPGNALAGKTISASCTVSLMIRDLLSASAVTGSRALYLGLGEATGRTPVSVADQIAQAVADRGGEAAYVVFDKKPGSAAGDLKCTPGQRYALSGEGTPLSQVRFEPDGSGAYVIGFTAYDGRGGAWPGLLTIAVEQSLGSADVLYITEKGAAAVFSPEDFQAFWQEAYPQGQLARVRFTVLPAASQGVLRRGYASAARPGTAVEAGENLYAADDGEGHPLLESVAFVPASRFTGPVILSFDAYGSDGGGHQTYRSGQVFLFVNASAVEDVACTVSSGGEAALPAAGFLSAYQAATGSRGSGFYIRFLDLPAAGALYEGRTAAAAGTRLTEAALGQEAFPYSAIGGLTYVAAGAAGARVPYAAYSAAGELLFAGCLAFTVRNPFSDVKDTDWFCTYVVELAEAGVVSGTTATTYSPRSNVTWGEALKLVLLATGREEQRAGSGHWAQGYLDLALKEGLLTEEADLRAAITRRELAELAAAAMGLSLPGSLEEGPFQDVPADDSAAGAIAALHEAGIVEGTALPGGGSAYAPDQPLKRSEIAAIIWRIQQAAD